MSSLLCLFAPVFLSPAPTLFLQLDETEIVAPPEDEAVPDEAPPPEETPLEAEAEPERSGPSHLPSAEEVASANSINAGLHQREDIRTVHRAFGIASWLSMAVTLTLGAIQFSDEYGGSSPGETPCGRFQPLLGQDFCFNSPPIPHLTSAVITSLLYYTTFTLSFMMPDPLGVAESPGWAGERLRVHKALRWAHFAGMIATTIFGVITANLPQSPAADAVSFETRQALAAVHLALAGSTYVLLSAAAFVMLF